MCSILSFCGTGTEYDKIQKALRMTSSRGPDASRILNTGNGWLGFNRLSIMGLTENGMQPFVYGQKKTLLYEDLPEGPSCRGLAPQTQLALVCNGEIYGFRPLKEELIRKGYSFISDSDC